MPPYGTARCIRGTTHKYERERCGRLDGQDPRGSREGCHLSQVDYGANRLIAMDALLVLLHLCTRSCSVHLALVPCVDVPPAVVRAHLTLSPFCKPRQDSQPLMENIFSCSVFLFNESKARINIFGLLYQHFPRLSHTFAQKAQQLHSGPVRLSFTFSATFTATCSFTS